MSIAPDERDRSGEAVARWMTIRRRELVCEDDSIIRGDKRVLNRWSVLPSAVTVVDSTDGLTVCGVWGRSRCMYCKWEER